MTATFRRDPFARLLDADTAIRVLNERFPSGPTRRVQQWDGSLVKVWQASRWALGEHVTTTRNVPLGCPPHREWVLRGPDGRLWPFGESGYGRAVRFFEALSRDVRP